MEQHVPVTPTADPVAPPVERTLAEFRAAKAEPVTPVVETPVVASVAVQPPADVEPPDLEDDAEPVVTTPKPPEAETHRWKDPDTGVRLDLRRKDHRRIKTLLEERADLARRASAPPSEPRPVPSEPAARVAAPVADPADPEPTLDQFADQPDPYSAHIAALGRYHARQEFRRLDADRTTVERAGRQQAQLDAAQQGWDAHLPEVRTRYPDFDATYAALYAALPKDGRQRPLVHRLLTSPVGHDLAHFLGSHPEHIQRLFTLPPHEHLVAIGALEAQAVVAGKKPATPSAPITPASAPMAPVGASATPTTYNAQTSNLAQFRQHHGVRGGRRVSA